MPKWLFLVVAFVSVQHGTARADELSDLRDQLVDLNDRVAEMQAQDAAMAQLAGLGESSGNADYIATPDPTTQQIVIKKKRK